MLKRKKRGRRNSLTGIHGYLRKREKERERKREMRKKVMLSVSFDGRIDAPWLKRSIRIESCLSMDRPILFVIVFPFGSVDRRYADEFFSGLCRYGLRIVTAIECTLQPRVERWIWWPEWSRSQDATTQKAGIGSSLISISYDLKCIFKARRRIKFVERCLLLGEDELTWSSQGVRFKF